VASDDVKLNRNLHLVTRIESPRGTLHVYSNPVPRVVFEQHFMIMGRAFTSIFNNGLGASAPKLAAMIIKQEAKFLGEEMQGEALLADIKRSTHVLTPSANGAGYEPLPYAEAVRQQLIDEEEAADIEGRICFFTLALRVGSERQIAASMASLRLFWDAETTSLTLSDYLNSLTTSTGAAATGPRPTPEPAIPRLSIPS
jgi:hypothetical protein